MAGIELIQATQIETIDGSELHYHDVYDRYLASELGAFHASQPPRYANIYEYDHAQMHADLGPDVHPVEHGRWTHDAITVPFLLSQNDAGYNAARHRFSAEEIAGLKLAAHLHDFGECQHACLNAVVENPPGDIAYGFKLPTHAKAEAAIRAHLRATMFPEIADAVWADSEKIIIGEDEEAATAAFDAIEHIGYYLTGLTAGVHALLEYRRRENGQGERDDYTFAKLRWLGTIVTIDHRTRTIPSKSDGFSYPAEVLQATTVEYDEIQKVLAPIVEAEVEAVNA